MKLGLLLTLVLTASPPQIQVHTEHRGDDWTFRGVLTAHGHTDCVLEVTYGFEHLAQFVHGVDEITLLREGTDWYEVRYGWRGLIGSFHSVYRKTLRASEGKVLFRLVSSAETGLIPQVQTSEGFYAVEPAAEDEVRVTYFQRVVVARGLLGDIYLRRLETEGRRFLEDLRDYLARACP